MEELGFERQRPGFEAHAPTLDPAAVCQRRNCKGARGGARPDPTCLGRKAGKLARVGVTAATVQVGGLEAPEGLSAEGLGSGAASPPGPPFRCLETSPDQPQLSCRPPVLIDAAS